MEGVGNLPDSALSRIGAESAGNVVTAQLRVQRTRSEGRLFRVAASIGAFLAMALVYASPSTAFPPTARGLQNVVRCEGATLAEPSASDRNPDGSPVRTSLDRRGKIVPVIMVHGWISSPSVFRQQIDLTTNRIAGANVPRSLIGQVARIPGALVFTFDYHSHSARWVDDPFLGAALGKAIDCLYRATGEKVIIVGHSMGGLIARYALTERGPGGVDRATEVSTVVTLGTPQAGSLLAGLIVGGLDAAARAGSLLAATVRLILSTCGTLSSQQLETGTLCDLLKEPLRAFDSAAGRALRVGSPELQRLKAFPSNVALNAIAGDTTMKVPGGGWFALPWDTVDVPMGDVIVQKDSAAHGATTITTGSCAYQLSIIQGITDSAKLVVQLASPTETAQPIWKVAGPCFHTNLMRTISFTNEVTGAISDDIRSRQPVTIADLLTAPVPSLCDHPAGRLVNGSLPGIPENEGSVYLNTATTASRRQPPAFGDLNGDGIGDAAAVVSCSQGGVAWPDSVQFYAPGPTRLGGISLEKISHGGREFVTSMKIQGGDVLVRWQSLRDTDIQCCPTLDFAARLRVDGKSLTVSNVERYDETSAATQLFDAARRGDTAVLAKLATPAIATALAASQRTDQLGSWRCYAGTYEEPWPSAAQQTFGDWPPLDGGDHGDRHCLVSASGGRYGLIGLAHTGYRTWQAVEFHAPRS